MSRLEQSGLQLHIRLTAQILESYAWSWDGGWRLTIWLLPKAWESGLPTICREPAANSANAMHLMHRVA